jgi:subtilisin family serine protease
MPPIVHSSRRLALCLIFVTLGAVATSSTGVAALSTSARQQHGFVRILVNFRPHASPRSLERSIAALGARTSGALPQLHVEVLRVPRRNVAAVISRLRRSHAVRYVERNRVAIRITSANRVTPTDPLWAQQWGAALTNAPTAWAVTRGAPSVIVAVLDTGVDFAQPDLQGAFVPGYDFVNNDVNPSDDLGHGTAVAGIIAARADNGLGGSGLCPRCSIMPVKVVGSDGTATDLNVASGITWAADHGARVINLSLGGLYYATIRAAVNYATSKGVLVVAAAGNNGNSKRVYPAAEDGVLSVAATRTNDTLYSWSEYGNWVAVAAPGCDLTTLRGAGYGEMCGTSASAAVVSALAGLAISYAPSASTDAITHAITSSARRIAGVTYGRVDFAGTLASLGATFKPRPTILPRSEASPPAATVLASAHPTSAATAAAGSSSVTPTNRPHRGSTRTRLAHVRAAWLLRRLRVEPLVRPR